METNLNRNEFLQEDGHRNKGAENAFDAVYWLDGVHNRIRELLVAGKKEYGLGFNVNELMEFIGDNLVDSFDRDYTRLEQLTGNTGPRHTVPRDTFNEDCSKLKTALDNFTKTMKPEPTNKAMGNFSATTESYKLAESD